MAKPICVSCGRAYGRRGIERTVVRWDTPTKQVQGGRGDLVTVPDGPPNRPPPYQGFHVLIKDGHAYLSADDNRMVMSRYTWDGRTWIGGYTPFCTLRCALDYARRAYGLTREV